MSNYNTQLQSNNTDLQTVLQTLQTKAAGGGEQATPVISVSSNGLITATAGTKSSTHQLAFQAAKTITPSTTSQIAVSSGYYTGGNVTVASVPTQSKTITPTSTTQNVTPDSGKFLSKVTVNGDSNLVASNIVSGKTIFGVTGTATTGGGGGDTSVEDSLITGTVSAYTNDRVTSIGSYAFMYRTSLTTVSFPAATNIGGNAFGSCTSLTTTSFPAATSIGSYAFYNCTRLTTVSFPAATSIGNYAFGNCLSLTTVSFPAATSIGNDAFYTCSRLTTVSLPAATSIGNYAFVYCSRLTKLYLTGSSLCALSNANAFSSTPIGGYSAYAGTYGSIYVPASLLTRYQTATNWTYFSSRFVGI